MGSGSAPGQAVAGVEFFLFFLKEYCFRVRIRVDNRELKQLRGRPQRRLQKNKRVNDQNNSSASA